LLPSAGTYYLKVQEYNNQALSPYRLHVRVTPGTFFGGPPGESEPNNTKDSADVIAQTEGTAVRVGSIADGIDRDYYSFQARGGDKVFVALDGAPDRDGVGPNFTLRFFQQGDLNVLIKPDSSVASTAINSTAEAFSYVIPTTGIYLVQVDADGPGDYRLL